MTRKFCLILAVILTASFSTVNAQQTAEVTSSGIGYLQYLPAGYHSSSKDYPVVISLHGIKEKGTSSRDPKEVIQDLPKVDNVGLPKYVKQGKKYPFILISPQLKSNHGSWPPSFIIEVLNHVKRKLRIDGRRVYLTGLSLGGMGVWRTAGEYPGVFAAIAPICAGGNALSKARAIAAENVAVWAFHGSSDHVVSYRVTTSMVNAINSAPKRPNPLAKVTLFPNMGHIIWDKAYNDTDLLDWMLRFRNGSSPRPPEEEPDEDQEESNNKPAADAGDDRTITLPDHTVTLEGKASDKDGDIRSYQWQKVSGGDAQLSGTSSRTLKVSELSEGEYVFRFIVKDNDGASDDDEVRVTVRKEENKQPVVSAGSDRTITLPANTVKLQGKATDPDGEVTSYQWRQVSGGRAQLDGSSSPALSVSGLSKGEYVFRLTVKDNDGASESDDVSVTVQEADNKRPVVNAGSDRTITLPTNHVSLRGQASDPDGEVASYQWTQIAGGHAELDGERSPALAVSGLSRGEYVFRLTVKDNDGASESDEVSITVHAADNTRPEVNAGTDRTITLPVNSVTLAGSARDADGKIVSYSWTKIAGGAARLDGTTSPTLVASDLSEGTYVFRFAAKDDHGAVVYDDMHVNVHKDLSSNNLPVVAVGGDKTVILPQNSIRLTASADDKDGSIVSYRWGQISGPQASVRASTSPDITISGLKEGTYVFRITVKDNRGASNADEIAVYVRHAFPSSIEPTDYKGTDRGNALPFDVSYPEGTSWYGGN